MILVLSFNNYDHKTMQVVDTNLMTKKNQKLFEEAIEDFKKGENYQKDNTPYVMVERYDYNKLYTDLKKAFIKYQSPLQIDHMVYIKEYDQMDGVMNSW